MFGLVGDPELGYLRGEFRLLEFRSYSVRKVMERGSFFFRKLGGGDNHNVVLDTGSKIKKGFTVVDIEKFLSLIKPQLDPNIFIENMLPF